MLYGAYGYSGERAARTAVERGERPVLAGRNEGKLKELAGELDLPYRAFALDDIAAVREQLWDIAVVVHAAGPFSATSAPMLEACIASGVHYTDITGEIAVFEHARGLDAAARKAGVVVCPGVGFDVIPTDCVAAVLHEAMPEAQSLCLGFQGDARPSRGTARTALQGVSHGMFVRRDGKLKHVPRDFALRTIDFGRGPRQAAVIPWGDLSTAFHTTSIPNITVYIPERRSRWALKLFPLQQALLSLGPVKRYAEKQIERSAKGPTADANRPPGDMYVWGEVANEQGDTLTARLKTANGYDVTVEGMLHAAGFLTDYKGRGGYFTPSQLFGKRVIEQFPGSTTIEFEKAAADQP